MRILFISHSSVVPTYQEKLRFIARTPGVELSLLVPRHWPEAGKRVSTAGIASSDYRIFSRSIVGEGLPGYHFYPFLAGVVRKVRPDIIHAEEEPFSAACWQACRAARRTGAKLVFFTWENIFEKFRWPQSAFRAAVLRTASHAIAGNTEARDLLLKAGLPAGRLSVMPQYGVNPQLFRNAPADALRSRLGLKGFTLGYMGRLVPEKGIPVLLEAVARMRERVSLLLVGSGPFEGSIREEAKRRGMEDRVVLTGAVDNREAPAYLNCMDVLVLPSRTTPAWKEQFGRVIIEAQSCGVPVAGSSSGAIPEVVGRGGLIFREGDPKALASCLVKLAESPGLRRELAEHGRRRVMAEFTHKRLAEKILEIYKKIVHTRN